MDNNYNHHFFVLALFLHQQKTFGPGLSCLCAMVRAWWESLCQTPCLSSQFVLSSSHLSYSPKKRKTVKNPHCLMCFSSSFHANPRFPKSSYSASIRPLGWRSGEDLNNKKRLWDPRAKSTFDSWGALIYNS